MEDFSFLVDQLYNFASFENIKASSWLAIIYCSKYISKSKLASNGALDYLINRKGQSRFPSDPLDPKNWTDEHTVR